MEQIEGNKTTGLLEFVENNFWHIRLRDGRNIYCDDDGRWFITGIEPYFDSFSELFSFLHFTNDDLIKDLSDMSDKQENKKMLDNLKKKIAKKIATAIITDLQRGDRKYNILLPSMSQKQCNELQEEIEGYVLKGLDELAKEFVFDTVEKMK